MTDDPLTFDRFLALPRLSGLRLSPDGSRLVVAVAGPDPEGKAMRTALWQIDPAGKLPARRLTRSAEGESSACFTADGSLLFTSARPDPDVKPDERGDKKTALWLLPKDGGEARLLAAPEGGVEGIAVARSAETIAFGSALHPTAATFEEDKEIAKRRKDAAVTALLFDDYPIRYWDEWLAPRRRRLFAATLPREEDPEAPLLPHDLTGDPGPVLVDTSADLSPDGGTLVTMWRDFGTPPQILADLVAIDTTSGERRYLTHGDAAYSAPRISPDGAHVVSVRESFATPDQAPRNTLWLTELATGESRELTPELDLWPTEPEWAPDSSAVFFVAGYHGGEAAFRVELADGSVTRLVSEGAVTNLCPSPDGETVYALRMTMTRPPHIVRFATRGADQTPEPLANAIEAGFAAPSRLERIATTAKDGTRIESWLVLPADAAPEKPAPLVVWVHGGPLGSWNAWSWRWNPNLLAGHGYAVLMPDPAFSVGYGQHMIDRGWGHWDEPAFGDIMAATDDALRRSDLDGSRTALMGGSYGGYMANWVAGHTDRFRAIVTHASLWDLRVSRATSDEAWLMEQEMGDPYLQPERYVAQSPSVAADAVRTPILVIHGERDFRVPVAEALGLWTDLRRLGRDARFLYFPDENHWVLHPQNSRIWYETVLAFLDEHVLGREWVRPALL